MPGSHHQQGQQNSQPETPQPNVIGLRSIGFSNGESKSNFHFYLVVCEQTL
jgi:hypothetical protein